MANVFMQVFALLYFSERWLLASSQIYRLKGSTVVFSCQFNGNAVSWWYRPSTSGSWTAYTSNGDITSLPVKSRISITGDFSSGEYNLNISDLLSSDKGYYRCVLTGGITVVTYVLIVIVGPTSVQITSKTSDYKIEGTEGQSLQMQCTATGGDPEPDMTLLIGGTEVETGKQSVTYSIQNLERSHDGQNVTCYAGYTTLNNFSLIDSANLYLSLKPLVPIFNKVTVNVIEGHNLEIECNSTGSRPKAVFSWDIGGVNITDSSEIISKTPMQSIDTHMHTVISRLRFTLNKNHNRKQLTCKAINIAAPNGVPAIPITVDVKYSPNVALDDKILTEETFPVELTCNADGNPDTYTFYQWTHESLQGISIRTLNETRDGKLTLPNITQTVRYQNTGRYTCTVGNGIPDTTTKRSGSGILTINAPPVFSLHNNWKQRGELMKTSNISAYVYSVPALQTFVWYRGSVEVRGTGYMTSSLQTTVTVMFHGKEIKVNGFMVTLTIAEVKESDFINYGVRVGNSRGSSEQNIIFEPSSAPDPPKNVLVIDQTDRSITVQWEVGNNGGYEQTFYIVYKPLDSSKWVTLAGPTSAIGSNQLFDTKIEGLQDSTKYEIKMFAENKIDKSAETLTLIGFTNIKSIAEFVTNLENKANTLTGVTTGLSIITVISVVIIAVLINRLLTNKRNSRRTTKRSISKDSMQTPEFYDNVTDTEENNLEIDGRNYDTLRTKDKPNTYEALGLSTKEEEADCDGRNYETLGTKDKPNVYDALGQSRKDRQSKLYSNTAI